ncbi:hypothetical protein [Clostridium sp. AM49-4BH]|uniref:hypothetical protein n=1 Tax=Clostridium sp. AM49-4BH TaxID=2293035 RepID=UPI0015F8AB1B
MEKERQIHLKEIYRKFTVDVMEFISDFSMFLIKMIFLYFFEIIEIVRAFRVYTFMDDEMLSAFDGNKTVTAMRAV